MAETFPDAGAAPAASMRPSLALPAAALFLAAAATCLLAARGNPYDGAPVVRVHVADAPKPPPVHAKPAAPAETFLGGALPPAPIPGLSAPGPGGLLPIIAPDGRASWKAYARPFVDDGRPKIALVIGGLGLNPDQTQQAIAKLPPEVTLAFSPYADDLQGQIDKARAAGHEVILQIPMEPLDYPNTDPGPLTLMANASPEELTHRFEGLMARGAGYFAVSNLQGGRFLTQDKALGAVSQALRQRGVAFIDDGQASGAGGLHRASTYPPIDAELTGPAIDNALLMLEANALRTGSAVGSGSGYPLTVAQIVKWATAVRQRGYALAPASALMTTRP